MAPKPKQGERNGKSSEVQSAGSLEFQAYLATVIAILDLEGPDREWMLTLIKWDHEQGCWWDGLSMEERAHRNAQLAPWREEFELSKNPAAA